MRWRQGRRPTLSGAEETHEDQYRRGEASGALAARRREGPLTRVRGYRPRAPGTAVSADPHAGRDRRESSQGAVAHDPAGLAGAVERPAGARRPARRRRDRAARAGRDAARSSLALAADRRSCRLRWRAALRLLPVCRPRHLGPRRRPQRADLRRGSGRDVPVARGRSHTLRRTRGESARRVVRSPHREPRPAAPNHAGRSRLGVCRMAASRSGARRSRATRQPTRLVVRRMGDPVRRARQRTAPPRRALARQLLSHRPRRRRPVLRLVTDPRRPPRLPRPRPLS